MSSKTRTINVDYIARVEGEASLHITLEDQTVRSVRLSIFEPPRFFEALLRGRHFAEAVDITSRICGICPVAYMMSAAHAMESACGVRVDGPLRELRRLLYCGEWIESHVLHVGLLHLPDFLGYEDAISMAKDHPRIVENALRIKAVGNAILRVLGGREIHPINVRVGGFYKLPAPQALAALRPHINEALAATQELLTVVAELDVPALEVNHVYLGLKHESEYPFNEGRFASTDGVDVAVADYETVLVEEHRTHSTALYSRRAGSAGADADDAPVCLGPAARFALNQTHLTPLAREAVRRHGLGDAWRHPHRSIAVRCVETLFALEEAARIIDARPAPEQPFVDVSPRAATGHGCTEAPRGSCYHRYRIDDTGTILEAKIVPPTAVNQAAIENDLLRFVTPRAHLSDDELRRGCEQVIRNFDPCISCAAHFLKLEIHRQ